MTTQTMLEKMAKAYDNEARPLRRGVRHFQSWSRKDKKDREDQMACMRAALQALREPTDGMKRAMYDATTIAQDLLIFDLAGPAFEAAIDAILQEKAG